MMCSTHNQFGRPSGMEQTPTSTSLSRITGRGSNRRSVQLALQWVLVSSTVGSVWGCAQSLKPHAAELSQTPLIVDSAMQKREWDRTAALYPSGGVPAWNTRFHYEASSSEPAWIKPISEPVAFLGQTAFLPITLITARPFTPVVYRGVQEPASSTAFPAPPDLRLSEQQQKSPGSAGGSSDGGGAYGGPAGGGK